MHPLHSSLPVETIWHTRNGFCLREDLSGHETEFHLIGRTPGSHREFVEPHLAETRIEDTNETRNGTPQKLVTGISAQVHAYVINTGDNLPLDPAQAHATVKKIWDDRIARARPTERAGLEQYQTFLLTAIDEVIVGRRANIITIEGIIGICAFSQQRVRFDKG